MLIPFLDILCSLIGVLVLIIVVLVVAQTQRINGRTKEEVQRAGEHLKLLKLQKENTLKYANLTEELEKLQKLEEEKKAKQAAADKLKDQMTNSGAKKEENMASAAKLQKELENLIVEIRGLTDQEPDLKKKMEELLAEIAKVQPPDKKDPSVMINPMGSGLAAGSAVFFVDATGDKMTYFWNEKQSTVVSSVPEVIVADTAFNMFLDSVKKVPQSKLIFLIRDDGMRSYNLGAGWAQSKHGYRVDQIGKLPVPGQGMLDMKIFAQNKLLGSLPVPPEAAAAAPATPAPAPGAPAMPPKPGAPPIQPAAPAPTPPPAPGAPAPAPAAPPKN